jgi:hypothetical protein
MKRQIPNQQVPLLVLSKSECSKALLKYPELLYVLYFHMLLK